MKEIPLTQGYIALVDDEDFERVVAYKWCAQVVMGTNPTVNKIVYAVTHVSRHDAGSPRQRRIYMHRMILDGPRIDHWDCDGLNNQKYNLRRATPSQNCANRRKMVGASSVYRGVSWSKIRNKWRSEIVAEGSTLHLGAFSDECDAATAYNFKAFELFGEFARLNVPLQEIPL